MILAVLYVAGATAWWALLAVGVVVQGGIEASAATPPKMSVNRWLAYMVGSGFVWPFLPFVFAAYLALSRDRS
jgi:hypothetical protein